MLDKLTLEFGLKRKLSTYQIGKSELEIDDLVDLDEACKDRLESSGFDSKYNPNEEGEVLERIIDKIFSLIEKTKGNQGEIDHGG